MRSSGWSRTGSSPLAGSSHPMSGSSRHRPRRSPRFRCSWSSPGAETVLTRDSRLHVPHLPPGGADRGRADRPTGGRRGLQRIGAIVADYGWGHAVESAMQTSFDAAGLEYQIEVAPVPEEDFTTYLRNLEEFDPDLIVATGHPPGSGAITVQSSDLGLDVEVTGAYTPFALVAGGAGDAAIGRYTDFKCADFESDEYQDLARRYLASSDNTFMEDDAVAGYGIVTMVAEAIAEVGDDPAAIAEWLHTQTFDLPGYPFEMSWTEWGEMAAAAPLVTVLGEGPAPGGCQRGRYLVSRDADPARTTDTVRAVLSRRGDSRADRRREALRRSPRRRRGDLVGRGGRDRRPRRSQRRRQDDPAEGDRRRTSAQCGHDPLRRPEHRRNETASGAPRRDRPGAPDAAGVREHDCARQRRTRGPVRRRPGGRAGRRRRGPTRCSSSSG